MTQAWLETIRRGTFGMSYLGIAGWVVWRMGRYDSFDGQSDLMVPAVMFCLFAMTTVFAAFGLLIPDVPDFGPAAREPVRIDDVAEDPADVGAVEDVRMEAMPVVVPPSMTRADEWRVEAFRLASAGRRSSDGDSRAA